MIQEQLSLKDACLYFPAFCLSLLDFKKENNKQFTIALSFLKQRHSFCRKNSFCRDSFCIFVDTFKLFFGVQHLDVELIHSSIKAMELNEGLLS